MLAHHDADKVQLSWAALSQHRKRSQASRPARPRPRVALERSKSSPALGSKRHAQDIELKPFRRTWRDSFAFGHDDSSSRGTSDEQEASFIAKVYFSWVTPTLQAGREQPLELADVVKATSTRRADVLARRLRAALDQRRKSKHPLLNALARLFFAELLFGAVLQLLSAIIQVLTPFLLRYLISFSADVYNAQLDGRAPPPLQHGMMLVGSIVAMQLCQSLFLNHALQRSVVMGAQLRAALTSLTFTKTFSVSSQARAGPNGWPNSRIVNLISTDITRIEQFCAALHPLWTAPFSILLALIFLYINISYSALVGLGILAVTTPLLGRAMRSLSSQRSNINKTTDARTGLVSEILYGMNSIKILGWEQDFLRRLWTWRTQEIHAIRRMLDYRNAVMSLSMAIPIFAAMLSFAVYSHFDLGISAARIFSSLGLFNSLRQPLSVLPTGIGQIADATAAVRRIEEFLLADDAPDSDVEHRSIRYGIRLRSACFTWEASASADAVSSTDDAEITAPDPPKKKVWSQRMPFDRASSLEKQRFSSFVPKPNLHQAFHLDELSLDIAGHELVAVIGDVGSGKSSLLTAIAGEMRRTAGTIDIGSKIAWSPASPWIQNATVRDNILFGKPYEPDWYDQVVNACALKHDFGSFRQGDLTEIGERGVTLSGGQKQRVAIARAVYTKADIYLFDDPLSALDAHVGQFVFKHVVCGLLRNKCRVLATHQLHVLPRCDKVVYLRNGRVVAADTYDRLHGMQTFARALPSIAETEPAAAAKSPTDAFIQKQVRDDLSNSDQPLMQAESRERRAVPLRTYVAYLHAGGTLPALFVVFVLVLLQGSIIGTSLWLSSWTSDAFGLKSSQYLAIYGCFGIAQAILLFLFCKSVTFVATQASNRLFRQSINAVVQSPMVFFDTTPLGRLVNRFTKDQDALDNILADMIRLLLITAGSALAVFVLITSWFRAFVLGLGPTIVLYLLYLRYYSPSAGDVKRLEATLRGEVLAKLSEAIHGVSTIRSYERQKDFTKTVNEAIDNMSSAICLAFTYQRWLGVRLDIVGAGLVLFTGFLVVSTRSPVHPSISGIILAYIIAVGQMLTFNVRYLTDTQNEFVSVERLLEYANGLVPEEPRSASLMSVSPSWPHVGVIDFSNVNLRYRPHLPLALSNFSLQICGGESLGVIGRTGAGKSSLISALLRLVNLESGSITIDGIDISAIALADLRRTLTVVPQDPKLFKGSIRTNLDPFDEHTDDELVSTLRSVGLAGDGTTGLETVAMALSTNVDDDGLNLSLGQRQLLTLGRALVRGSRITLLDEATTAIDHAMDAKIQRVLADAFRGKTLVCIAHRLRTVISFDRICVMASGTVAEIGRPRELFDRAGIFRGMCEQSGIRREEVA